MPENHQTSSNFSIIPTIIWRTTSNHHPQTPQISMNIYLPTKLFVFVFVEKNSWLSFIPLVRESEHKKQEMEKLVFFSTAPKSHKNNTSAHTHTTIFYVYCLPNLPTHHIFSTSPPPCPSNTSSWSKASVTKSLTSYMTIVGIGRNTAIRELNYDLPTTQAPITLQNCQIQGNTPYCTTPPREHTLLCPLSNPTHW